MAKLVLTIQAKNEATASVSALNKEVQALSKTLSSITVNKDLTAQINALTKHYTALANAQTKVVANTNKQAIAEEKLRQQQTKTNIEAAKLALVQARLDKTMQQSTTTTKKASSALKQHTEATDRHQQSLASMIPQIIKWNVAMTAVMLPIRMLKSALSSLNETLVKTEDTVIALQRVLPSGSATDNEISSKVYNIAQKYGQTFENVSQIATNFARTGMSWADTIKATEAAVLALNVAELDAEQATTGLIAILSQFNLGADDLEGTIDKLNKTADNFPVTTEKILAALQRTGSAASNANLSLNQTIALVTALSKATGRSGENIGTALNSLIQYSSKSSALDTFAALSKESAAVVDQFRQGGATILDVWRQVSKEIKNLKTDQADLLDQYFNTEDGEALKEALDGELQDIYTELGGVYDTANTFRKNYFIALLGNMDTVEEALGTLGDAAGYSQTENEKYLNTYTAKLNSLKAQWQDIANDEQGLLGIKKDLVDMASAVLNIVKGVGGLKAVLAIVAMWVTVIVAEVKGAALVAGLQKVLGVITNIATLGLPNLIKQIKLAKQGIAEAGAVAKAATSTALLGITALLTALSAIDAAIRRSAEERAEAERKAREEQDAAIAASNAKVDAQEQEVQSMADIASSVETLRNVLDSSTASEDEKRAAQEKLLQIQNSLVESNNTYKDSLDLTNGALAEQLGLIEKLTTEQLKQKAQDFLSQNQSEIAIAQSRLYSKSTTTTDMLLSSWGSLNAKDFRETLNKAITGAGVGDIASVNEDNTYTFFDNYGKKVREGFKKGFWNGLGALTGFSSVFDAASYGGEANAGFSFSGTVEEQLAAIEKLKEYVATHRDELGLSNEQIITFTTELQNKFDELNSEEYQQAQRLNEIAKATQDFLDGTITEAEYLEKVYGITKATAEEIKKETNNIQDHVNEYDELIDKLKELRDAQKESLDLEEKKKDYLEAQNELIKAQQALENAKNEATVRRYNETTGQWEWQVDEKKVAEAEEEVQKQQESVEKARQDLEKQAYDTIIKQLEQQTATNQSILDIIEAVAPLLGDDFGNAVKGAIKSGSNVDLDKPVKSYDNGGVASGLGYMPKATNRPEAVLDPELTAQILAPVSNERFHQFARDLGLMFETQRNFMPQPIIERMGGNTDNRVDNSGQIIFGGGLTVGADKRGSSVDDILAIAGIVAN